MEVASKSACPFFSPGEVRTFTIGNPVAGPTDNIIWIVSGSAMQSTKTCYGVSVNIAPDKAGVMTVLLVDGNGCSPYNEVSASYQVLNVAIHIPRNPAEGTAGFSVVVRSGDMSAIEADQLDDATASLMARSRYNANSGCYEAPYDGAYRIELWHKQFGMVRSVDMPAGSPNAQISISGLASGDYIARLIIDGNVADAAPNTSPLFPFPLYLHLFLLCLIF
ncbi:MAG: hypothetical protein ACI3Z7_07090 [Candidatus Aphodosoma sp.]